MKVNKKYIAPIVLVFALLLASAPVAFALPKNKSIAVVMYESGNWLDKGFGTAETIIKRELMRNGYKVLNETGKLHDAKSAAGFKGDAAVLRKMRKQYGFAILVGGETIRARGEKNEFGMYTTTTTVNVQAWSAENGLNLLSETITAKEVGYTEGEASQKALVTAAEKIAQLLMSGGTSAKSAESSRMQLVVDGVGSMSQAQALLSTIKQLPRVSEVLLTDFSGGTAVFSITAKDSVKAVLDSLSRTGAGVEVTGITGNIINARKD